MLSMNIALQKVLTYDAVVVGGGFAGVGAAVSAAKNGAKTLLIECGGDLGGDITKAIIPNILDLPGKGGLTHKLYSAMVNGGHTCVRKGTRYDEQGNKIPGTIFDLEYTKYYLEKFCLESGVDVLLNSMMAGCEISSGRIKQIAVATECGCIGIDAQIFIDATGNGLLAAMAGCKWEIGEPQSGKPQPASSAMYITNLPQGTRSTDSSEEKTAAKKMLAKHGIDVSAEGVTLMHSTTDGVWMLTFNNQFDITMDDPISLSRASMDARAECIEVLDKISEIPQFNGVKLLAVSSHIGIREGKRINGEYRLTLDDITAGQKFDDAICTVNFPVDVHSIRRGDGLHYDMGKKALPYHIPYRSLIPIGCDNLLLAGRCISGDFYAHSSYRVAGCALSIGEAAGFAAAICVKNGIIPHNVNGTDVKNYMISLGYEI